MPMTQISPQVVDAVLDACQRLEQGFEKLSPHGLHLCWISGAAGADLAGTALQAAEEIAAGEGWSALMLYARERARFHLTHGSALRDWREPKPILLTVDCAITATALAGLIGEDLKRQLLAPLEIIEMARQAGPHGTQSSPEMPLNESGLPAS